MTTTLKPISQEVGVPFWRNVASFLLAAIKFLATGVFAWVIYDSDGTIRHIHRPASSRENLSLFLFHNPHAVDWIVKHSQHKRTIRNAAIRKKNIFPSTLEYILNQEQEKPLTEEERYSQTIPQYFVLQNPALPAESFLRFFKHHYEQAEKIGILPEGVHFKIVIQNSPHLTSNTVRKALKIAVSTSRRGGDGYWGHRSIVFALLEHPNMSREIISEALPHCLYPAMKRLLVTVLYHSNKEYPAEWYEILYGVSPSETPTKETTKAITTLMKNIPQN